MFDLPTAAPWFRTKIKNPPNEGALMIVLCLLPKNALLLALLLLPIIAYQTKAVGAVVTDDDIATAICLQHDTAPTW
ncbi:unnamed protein product [Ceratitis capitata]|uniref:(Mediterranean fruit fly) hypothetical protein n=1 Tax=Ceratitis capitata TaxID=7213 RepID=A0A811UGT6_CERCA|nr:unnamed protein product [Ceratitis capitata]